MAGIVLIDWENIFYSLERDYKVSVPAFTCLKIILGEAKRQCDSLQRTTVFYGHHLQDEELLTAIRHCAATPYPLAPQSRGQIEKNLADTYLCTEALTQFFELRPEKVLIVAGDKGYTPVLKAVQERGGRGIVFGLEKSMAQVLKESEFLREVIIYLDQPLVQSSQRGRPGPPVSTVAGARPATPAQAYERTTLDIQTLLMVMTEHLTNTPHGQISRGLMRKLLGLEVGDPEWTEWSGLIDVAERGGQLISAPHAMRDGKVVPHYRPNWRDPLARDTILGWTTLVSTIRELTRRKPTVPLVVVLDNLAPDPSDPETGQPRRGENPERELLKALYSIGVDRGAIQAETEVNAANGRVSTVIKLNPQHALVARPVQVGITIDQLPEPTRDAVRTLEEKVRSISETMPAKEVSLGMLFNTLSPGFPKKALAIAETIGCVELRKDVSDRGFPMTYARPATSRRQV